MLYYTTGQRPAHVQSAFISVAFLAQYDATTANKKYSQVFHCKRKTRDLSKRYFHRETANKCVRLLKEAADTTVPYQVACGYSEPSDSTQQDSQTCRPTRSAPFNVRLVNANHPTRISAFEKIKELAKQTGNVASCHVSFNFYS